MHKVEWFQKGTEALVAGARAYLKVSENKDREVGKKEAVPENPPAPPMYPAVNLFE